MAKHKVIKSIYLSIDLIDKIEAHAEENKMNFNSATIHLIEKGLPTSEASAKENKQEKRPEKEPVEVIHKSTGKPVLDIAINSFIDKHERYPTPKEIKHIKKNLGINE